MFSSVYRATKPDVNVRIKKMTRTPKATFAAKNKENVPAYSNKARIAARTLARLSLRAPKYAMAEVVAAMKNMKMLSMRKTPFKSILPGGNRLTLHFLERCVKLARVDLSVKLPRRNNRPR